MIRQVSLSVYVIIHCNVLIIIRLLVFIIGKLCSRLSRVDSRPQGACSKLDVEERRLIQEKGLI